MEKKLADIRALLGDQVEGWVWKYLVAYATQARLEGASRDAILKAFGLFEALRTEPKTTAEPLYNLRDRYEALRNLPRSEETALELRDLAEECLAAGYTQPKIAEALGVSRGTVRNLLNPYYETQTPEERAAYRLERAEVRRAYEELLG